MFGDRLGPVLRTGWTTSLLADAVRDREARDGGTGARGRGTMGTTGCGSEGARAAGRRTWAGGCSRSCEFSGVALINVTPGRTCWSAGREWASDISAIADGTKIGTVGTIAGASGIEGGGIVTAKSPWESLSN